jgi:hypothetical protein
MLDKITPGWLRPKVLGEYKANMIGWLAMARRPEFLANGMTREQLRELKRSLSMLNPHAVRDDYQKMLGRCRLLQGTLPTPRMMQYLVTPWKVLWK